MTMCVAPVDGIVIESHGLIIDEASLTGEADPIKKTLEEPWVRSGTQVKRSRSRTKTIQAFAGKQG